MTHSDPLPDFSALPEAGFSPLPAAPSVPAARSSSPSAAPALSPRLTATLAEMPVAALRPLTVADAPESVHFLPNGTPLLITIARKALWEELLATDGADYAFPKTVLDCITLLFLAAHHHATWCAPRVLSDGSTVPPLRTDLWGFLATAEEWIATVYGPDDGVALVHLALSLWLHHHETMVSTEESAAQKKTVTPGQSPPAGNGMSTNSPAVTTPAGSTSFSSSPSAPPTPPSTAAS